MSKRIKIIIIVLVVLSLILILSSLILSNSKKDPVDFDVKIDKIDICKSQLCVYNSPQYVHYIELKTEDEKLQEEINILNKNTEKYAKISNDSTVDGDECINAKDIYNHSQIIDSQTYKFSDENYFSVCITRVIHNVCTNTDEVIEPDIINYSVRKGKFLTDDDLKKVFKVSDEDINNGLQKELDTINKDAETNYKLSDIKKYRLYIDEGRLAAMFYIPDLKMYLGTYITK